MATDAASELFGEIAGYVERMVRPYAEKLASLEAKHAVELAEIRARVSTLPDLYAQTEIVATTVADAIAKLPRPENGKSVTVDDVRPMLEQMVAALPKPEDGAPGLPGAPGKDAEVDYDRLGNMLAVFAEKEALKHAPKDGAPGKDAVVDYSIVKEFANAAAVAAVAALPKPEKGKDGEPGKDGAPGQKGDPGHDGKSVDVSEVAELAARAVAAEFTALPSIPETVDAAIAKAFPPLRDVLEVKIQRHFSELPAVRDGKDADEDAIAARVLADVVKQMPPAPGVDPAVVEQAVAQAVAALPAPQNGKDADEPAIVERVLSLIDEASIAERVFARVPTPENGKDADEERIVTRVLERIPPPQPGERGKDAEPIHPDTLRLMVREVAEDLVTKAVATIPPAKDGDSVDPEDVRRMVDAEIMRQFEQITPYIKGDPGAPGFSPDDLRLAIHGRSLTVGFEREGMPVIERTVTVKGLLLDAGLYERGKEYEQGDCVTYGGSMFVATCDTAEPIGTNPPSKDWRLLVKKGRDAA